jgi:hypothetical protein
VCVLQPSVPGATVRYEPRHLQRSTYRHETGKTPTYESQISYLTDGGEKASCCWINVGRWVGSNWHSTRRML